MLCSNDTERVLLRDAVDELKSVVITNTSSTEPIVMLKHFAEDPEPVVE